jgi:hypothetical protein
VNTPEVVLLVAEAQVRELRVLADLEPNRAVKDALCDVGMAWGLLAHALMRLVDVKEGAS